MKIILGKFRKLVKKGVVSSVALKHLIIYPMFYISVLIFKITGKTSYAGYWSMRQIYCLDWPKSVQRISDVLPLNRSIYNFSGPSYFDYSQSHVDQVVEGLRSNGYLVLPFELPEEIIFSLEKIAREASCQLRGSATTGKRKVDIARLLAPRYDIMEEDLVDNPIVRKLAQDSFFLNVAQKYLGVTPVNDLITMWWNFPFSDSNLDEIAQNYHFDLDRARFFKIFFYLSEVGPDNGPHCFIKGSHNFKPFSQIHDGRYSDEEIYDAYGRENEITFIGKRGLILAEDTSGFHKGSVLTSGFRLMFQLQYTSSLFGAEFYSSRTNKINPEVRTDFAKNADVFKRFFL
jgi:hypothetical protein